MSVTANITDNGTGLTDRFFQVNEDYKKYVTELKKEFPTQSGGSDHFIGTFNEIESLVSEYNNNPANIPAVMKSIQNSDILCSWVSAVFCAMIYGFDGDNLLSIQKIPFETYDETTDTKTPIAGVEYLKVWKDKFDIDGVGKTNDSDSSYTVNGNAEPFGDGEHSLNIISFADNSYPNILGCYSSRYFVIPLKEFKLSVYEDISPWRMKYFELISHREDFAKYINTLNVRQKVLLHLSAYSIPAGAPEPIKLIKDIIVRNISVNEYKLNLANAANIPSFKTICRIQFYKTASVIDLDNILSKDIYIGIDLDNDGNYIYRATYPITDILVGGLKSGRSSMKKIEFSVACEQGRPNTLASATFSFDYYDELLFLAAANVAAVTNPLNSKLEYIYHVSKKYEKDNIVNLRQLQTICMFPNISAEYEDRCKKFTYFSLDGSEILNVPMNGVRAVEHAKGGIFRGVVDKTGNRQVIIRRGVSDGIYYTRKSPNGNIFTTTATVPEHFIDVCDMNGTSCGYALNIRCNGSDIPALLTNPMKGSFTIQLIQPAAQQKQPMYAYVDFGSSTSCMKYKIANGNLIEGSTVLEDCIVRTFLAEYMKKDYKFVINDPKTNNYNKFMSVSTVYDNSLGVSDYSVYKDGWMPVIKNLSGYEPDIEVSASEKTKLVKSSEILSPNIIINNLCYTIACNAVAKGCDEVFIAPTLPNREYLESLLRIWNDVAIRNIENIFPGLKINNVLKTDDIQYLLESIAVSNGIPGKPTGTLMVSVDMGDGTTDMSAVILKDGIVHPCGQASIEYAGKNLIKQTIRDILEHVPKGVAEKMFKGEGNFSPLFTPFDKSNDGIREYDGKINNLIRKFFDGDTLKSPKEGDDTWENKVMDILDISNLQSGIDQKVAANFTLRYMILMPVVKDFVRTAIKLAGNMFNGAIIIDFVGGSAKGIELLSVVDNRSYNNSGKILNDYFIKEFSEYTVSVRGITPQPGRKTGKDTLIDGLDGLDFNPDPNNQGFFNITLKNSPVMNDQQKADLNKEWEDSDAGVGTLVLPVHRNALNVPFKSMDDCENLPNPGGDALITVAHRANEEILNDPASYYKDYSSKDNPDVPLDEFRDYFNNEIFEKLINNHDNNPDAIEAIIQNFVNNASESMRSAMRRELLKTANNNSFYRATHSSIYPEMVKNAIFMFTVSKLISEFHRGYNSNQIISKTPMVSGYQFGG